MEITCGACATSLHVPDEKLPKNVPSIMAACPKCKAPIEIRIPQDAPAPAPAAAAPAPEPAPASAPAPVAAAPAPRAPQDIPAPPPAAEDFSENRKLAMTCFADPELQSQAKSGLEAAGYEVHSPAKAVDALHWLRRGKYEIVLIHEGFDELFLKTLQPMAMSLRRHMCIGLAGKSLQTMDNMAAFAKSVNFVVAERELDKLKGIARQALADNDQFYRIFREAVHDAGKV